MVFVTMAERVRARGKKERKKEGLLWVLSNTRTMY